MTRTPATHLGGCERWTDPAGFESVRLQEQAKGTDEVVQGSAAVTALDTQLRHDGTPLTTPADPEE